MFSIALDLYEVLSIFWTVKIRDIKISTISTISCKTYLKNLDHAKYQGPTLIR